MKRYALFAGDYYYPEGGWNDFVASYDSPDEAATRGKQGVLNGSLPWEKGQDHWAWWHVIDLHTGERLKPAE